MREPHARILRVLRLSVKDDVEGIKSHLDAGNDDALLRLLFASYRGSGTSRGLRLTDFGLRVMRNHFSGIQIALPEGKPITTAHLIFLDRAATMPYYCSKTKGIIVFETFLGFRLLIASGNLDRLIDESGLDVAET